MSKKVLSREDTKKHISSLLVSAGATSGTFGKTLTVKQLEDDFLMFIGARLPVRELGYTTVEEFFRDMPDVVQLISDRGQLCVQGVSSKNTAHIEKMIASQKSKPKRGAASKPAPPRRGPYNAPRQSNYSRNAPIRRYPQPHNQPKAPVPTVPAMVRGMVKDMLLAYPNGISVGPNFEQAFYRRYNEHLILQNFGCVDQIQFLKSMEDIIEIEMKGGEMKVRTKQLKPKQGNGRWIADRSQVQREMERQPFSQGGQRQPFSQGNQQTQFSQGNQQTQFSQGNQQTQFSQGNQQTQFSQGNQQNQFSQGNQTQFSQGNQQNQRESYSSSQSNQPRPIMSQNIQPVSRGQNRQSSYGDERPSEELWLKKAPFVDDENGVSEEMKTVIQQVLSKYPNGLWSIYFQSELKKLTGGRELPIKQMGFHSLIELMSSLPDIVTIERPGSNDWLLFDARFKRSKPKPDPPPQKTEPITPVPERRQPPKKPAAKKPTSTLNPKFCETVRQVVAAYPCGVPVGELAKRFEELTDCQLPMRELGFASLELMLLQLTHVIKVDYRGEGKGVLLTALEPQEEVKYNMLVRQPKEESLQEVGQDGVPSDAVGPGRAYAPLHVPEGHQEMEVFVGHILSPHKFWMQIKGPKTTDALEDLMDKLEAFYYGAKSKLYRIPEALMMIGQICVAIYPDDNNWHRVVIMNFRELDFVQVYFTDYGGTAWVHKDNLRLLRSQFLRLPAQAVVARLANIKPASGDEWDKRANYWMLNLCANRPLYCLVTDIDIDNVLSVCLCDTTGAEDVHINDTLVAKGLAVISMNCELGADAPEPQEMLDTIAGPLGGEPQDSFGDQDPLTAGQPKQLQHVQLTPEYSMHIIKYESSAYVASGEISAFIWQKDLLRSMLRQKKRNQYKLVLTKEENVKLFQEFVKHEVAGTYEGELAKAHVTVYELSSVPSILRLFKHPSQELIDAVEDQVMTFDPEDPYWKGGEGDGTFEDFEDSGSQASTEFSLQEWKSALETLLLCRRRILQSMMDSVTEMPGTSAVEQLQKLEGQMAEIRRRIRDIEQNENPDKRVFIKKFSEEDELVGTCIDQQYNATLQTSSAPDVSAEPSVSVSPAKGIRTTNTVAPMQVSNTVTMVTSGQPTSTATSQSSTKAQTAPPSTAPLAGSNQQQMQNVLLQYQMLMNQSMVQNQLLTQMMANPEQALSTNTTLAASHLATANPLASLPPQTPLNMLPGQNPLGANLLSQMSGLNLGLGAGLPGLMGRGAPLSLQQQPQLFGSQGSMPPTSGQGHGKQS